MSSVLQDSLDIYISPISWAESKHFHSLIPEYLYIITFDVDVISYHINLTINPDNLEISILYFKLGGADPSQTKSFSHPLNSSWLTDFSKWLRKECFIDVIMELNLT